MEIVLAALVAAAVAVAVVLLVQRPRAAQVGARRWPRPSIRARAGGGRTGPMDAQRRPRGGAASRAAPRSPGSRSACAPRRARSTSRPRSSPSASARSTTAQRNLDHAREELKEAKARQLRELERVAGLSAGQAKQITDARARGRAAPRERAPDPSGRGGDPPRRRPPRPQHPRRRDAARGVEPRRRDHRVGRRAQVRRAEGPHHRPRGPQHPRARDAHRDRLHHRRHARRRAAVRLRRRAPRDRPARRSRSCSRTAASTRRGSRRPSTRPSPRSTSTSSRWASRRCSRPTWARLHPELVKLLGRLRFRTSYGQNVLHHSIECARLAAMLADELGADPRIAARAALLHDIGKAVSHETEGPHALVGGELARRYKESEAVAHAMEAHHNEVELQTVEAVIVQIVDALSGARPGRARRVARAVRQAPARARGDRHPPRGRRQGLRDARRPRDPRDRAARRRSTTTPPRCSRTRSPARSRRSSSTRARSRSR